MAHKKTAIKHRPFLFFPRTMSSLVKKEKQEPELPATPTQTSWGEGEVGFAQCRLGQEEESSHSQCGVPFRFQGALHQGWKVWFWLTPRQSLTCTTLQHAPTGWQIWLSCRPPQSLVVYMTPSNYAIGLIMPKYYRNFQECLRQAKGWSLQKELFCRGAIPHWPFCCSACRERKPQRQLESRPRGCARIHMTI